MNTMTIFFLFLSVGLVFTKRANSFPDLIRHGYSNCTTCHLSPSGGGVLNGYGRSLSKELISTWSTKDEELPLHGLVKIPNDTMDRFLIGGDARYLSRKTEGKDRDVDEGFLMQAQLRVALIFEKVKLIVSLGKIENPKVKNEVRYVSPEYYALWTPKEEVYVRAGRFEPIFGLRLPDHSTFIRSEAGFQPWIERDTIEFSTEGETQLISLAGFQSTSATNPNQQKTGFTASLYQVVKERYRLGISMMNSEGVAARGRVYSFSGALGFTEKFYSLIEMSRASENGTDKDLGFIRTGYEVTKGFTPLLQVQYKNTLGQDDSMQSKSGLGFIFYPRPHFEIMSLVEKVQMKKADSLELSVLLHYYL